MAVSDPPLEETKTKIFKTRIKQRRDTSANWESKNPVLLNGEVIIVDTANGETRTKTGNGTKTYTQLPFDDEGAKGGKSLIDQSFADKVSTSNNTTTIDNQLKTYSITTRLEADVAITGLDENGQEVIKHKLSEKANSSDILTKTNTSEFTPTADYQPATKKYVDDSVSSVGSGDMLKSVYDKDNDGIIDDVALLQYYGTTDIAISNPSYFTVNETGETITGLTDTGKTQTELVIPYEINGVKITTLFSGSDGISRPPVSILNGNSTITKVVIPKSVTTLGGAAFANCKLSSINIPNSVTNIGVKVFRNCSLLTSVYISDSVTSIGDYAFEGCNRLTSINIPKSVTTLGDYIFVNCSGLTSINLSNSVTSIRKGVFSNCSGLTSINIPNSVTDIDNSAFYNCANLKIYCEQGSYAETFAKANNISVVYTDIKATALDNKVDKVEGKNLIDESVAKYITYNADDDSLHIDKLRHVNLDDHSFVTDFSGKLEFRTFLNLPNNNTDYDGGRLTLDPSGLKLRSNFDQNTDVIDISHDGIKVSSCSGQSNQSIVVNAPLGEIKLITDGKTHKLSEKANTSDVLVKDSSGNFVYGGTIISQTQVATIGHALTNKSEAKTYTVSVPTTSWTEKTDTGNQKYYYKKITVSGMTASGQAMTDVAMSDSVATARKEMEAYQCVNRVVTGAGYVELYCFDEVPTTAFTLRILVISNILS